MRKTSRRSNSPLRLAGGYIGSSGKPCGNPHLDPRWRSDDKSRRRLPAPQLELRSDCALERRLEFSLRTTILRGQRYRAADCIVGKSLQVGDADGFAAQ